MYSVGWLKKVTYFLSFLILNHLKWLSIRNDKSPYNWCQQILGTGICLAPGYPIAYWQISIKNKSSNIGYLHCRATVSRSAGKRRYCRQFIILVHKSLNRNFIIALSTIKCGRIIQFLGFYIAIFMPSTASTQSGSKFFQWPKGLDR